MYCNLKSGRRSNQSSMKSSSSLALISEIQSQISRTFSLDDRDINRASNNISSRSNNNNFISDINESSGSNIASPLTYKGVDMHQQKLHSTSSFGKTDGSDSLEKIRNNTTSAQESLDLLAQPITHPSTSPTSFTSPFNSPFTSSQEKLLPISNALSLSYRGLSVDYIANKSDGGVHISSSTTNSHNNRNDYKNYNNNSIDSNYNEYNNSNSNSNSNNVRSKNSEKDPFYSAPSTKARKHVNLSFMETEHDDLEESKGSDRDLHKRLNSQIDYSNSLLMHVKQLEGDASSMRSFSRNLSIENSRLDSVLQDYSQEIRALDEQLRTEISRREESDLKLKETTTELFSKNSIIAQLEGQLSVLSDRCRGADSEMASLLSKNRSLESSLNWMKHMQEDSQAEGGGKLEKAQVKVEQLETSKMVRQVAFELLESNHLTLQNDYIILTRFKDDLELKLKHLNADIEAAAANNTRLSNDLLERTKRLHEVQIQAADQETKHASILKKYTDVCTSSKEYFDKNEELLETIIEKEGIIGQLKHDLAKATAEVKRAVGHRDQIEKQLGAKILEADAAYRIAGGNSDSTICDLRNNVKELNHQLQIQMRRNDSDKIVHEQQLSTVLLANKDLTDKMELMRRDNMSTVDNLIQENKDIKRSIDRLEADLDRARESKKEGDTKWQIDMRTLQDNNARLKEELLIRGEAGIDVINSIAAKIPILKSKAVELSSQYVALSTKQSKITNILSSLNSSSFSNPDSNDRRDNSNSNSSNIDDNVASISSLGALKASLDSGIFFANINYRLSQDRKAHGATAISRRNDNSKGDTYFSRDLKINDSYTNSDDFNNNNNSNSNISVDSMMMQVPSHSRSVLKIAFDTRDTIMKLTTQNYALQEAWQHADGHRNDLIKQLKGAEESIEQLGVTKHATEGQLMDTLKLVSELQHQLDMTRGQVVDLTSTMRETRDGDENRVIRLHDRITELVTQQTELLGQLNFLTAIKHSLSKQLDEQLGVSSRVVASKDAKIAVLQESFDAMKEETQQLRDAFSKLQEKYARTQKDFQFVKTGAMRLTDLAVSESEKHTRHVKSLEDTIGKMGVQLNMKQSLFNGVVKERDDLLERLRINGV